MSCQCFGPTQVIVFLPGIADITTLFENLAPLDDARELTRAGVIKRADCPRLRIFALHSMIPRQEQEEVFNEVPEAGLALRRSVQYDTRRLMCCLVTTWCSQSSCKQRRGRAGRTMPGRAVCLVPRRFFEKQLPLFDPPEMLNAPLTKLYLQAKQLCSTLTRVADRVHLPPEVHMDVSAPKALLQEVVQPPSLELLDPIMMHSLFVEWIRAGAPRGVKALGSFVRDWSIIPKKFESLTTDATDLTVRFLKLLKPGAARSNLEATPWVFLHNKFSEEIETTVGAAFNTKTIESRGRQVKFEIWDTAGQERFRSLAPMYYRGASAAVVVYDQTNAVTFERAQEWVRQVMSTSTNPNIVIALAANKADMEDKRQVPWEKAEAFAQQEGLFLLDTSAMSRSNEWDEEESPDHDSNQLLLAREEPKDLDRGVRRLALGRKDGGPIGGRREPLSLRQVGGRRPASMPDAPTLASHDLRQDGGGHWGGAAVNQGAMPGTGGTPSGTPDGSAFSQRTTGNLMCSSYIDEWRRMEVCVRLRPGTSQDERCAEPSKDAHAIRLKQLGGRYDSLGEAQYQFDHVFPEEALQEEVFNVAVAPICEGVLSGYNGAVIAYGQTGSGKTHTVVGNTKFRGVAPRAVHRVFEGLAQSSMWSVDVSVLEIYNERARDLLSPGNLTHVEVHEVRSEHEGSLSFRCPDAVRRQAQTPEEALAALAEGMKRRETARTDMNHHSSRSHLIFTLTATQRDPEIGATLRGRLHLVDLAGSERLKRSMSTEFSPRGLQWAILPVEEVPAVGYEHPETNGGKLFGKRAKLVRNRPQINLEVAHEPSAVVEAFVAKKLEEMQRVQEDLLRERQLLQAERSMLQARPSRRVASPVKQKRLDA
eukprot:g6943.t1